MFKLLSPFFVLFFLLSHTALTAEENIDTSEPVPIEEQIPQEIEAVEAQSVEVEPTEDAISDAQREADAAEAAELREAGEGEEPLVE